MRGEVLDFNDATGQGLVSGEDGQRYSLTHRDLIRPAYIAVGMVVDFMPREGVATDVVVIQAAPRTSSTDRYAPQRQAPASLGPWDYFVKCLRLYADGNGRARRSEYWWFMLFKWLILMAPMVPGFILAGIGEETYSDGMTALGGLFFIVTGIGYLAFILPSLCVAIRRFHDVGLTGWLILLNMIPYVGVLITFVITLLPSQNHRNTHGSVPDSTNRETAEIFS